MNSISVATAACLQSFPQLAAALQDAEHCRLMPGENLKRESDRFKIWCGNLGALQTGRSSLNFRLRDSTVVRTNVLKLLASLQRILTMSTEVAIGARLPFDKLPKPEDSGPSDEENEEEDSDEDSDGDSNEDPPTELGLHMDMITEILGDLYKLSFRIRNSATRPRSLKPSLYKEVDVETGVDKFTTYADFDKRHVEESFIQLRKEAAEKMHMDPTESAKILEEDVGLVDRMAATLTERRKVLRYWQRHAKKLATETNEPKEHGLIQSSSMAVPNDKLDAQGFVGGSKRVQITPAPSVLLPKTILSGTVATEYDSTLDDMLDTQSVVSYASTSFDVHGNVLDLPSPPATAFKQTEFLCPYCGIVYPSRYAKRRAWRAHVLQDLQPYICTYPDCPDALQMYSTRHAWLEHERLVHRRVWQCFEHRRDVFCSESDLRRHLESQHNDDVTEAQVQDLLDVSESSHADAREKCPICLIGKQFFKELAKHMSFHLEKFATFSVSRGIPTSDEEDSSGADGQSEEVQGLGSVNSPPSGTLCFESPAQSVASPADDATSVEVSSLDYEKEQFRSSEHSDTLTDMVIAALTYSDQGQWKEAEQLEVQVMETRARVLGAKHPDTLTSMANLAATYRKQGRKEAEELEVQVMETRKRVLGAEHPDTLTSMANLAATYRNQGRWKEAEELEVQVMETRKRVLGAEHPNTLTSMANLAATYRIQGRWKEAEELEVQVMETRKRVLGAEHPNTLTSMANLAATYRNQGRWREAEELEVQVMETSKRVLGQEHPDTWTSMANLAFTWKAQDNNDEALELMTVCFEKRKLKLGLDHPDTIFSLETLNKWRMENPALERLDGLSIQ